MAHDRAFGQGPARLDDAQVDRDREAGNRPAVGQPIELGEAADSGAEVVALAPVERLFRPAEVVAPPPAHLDDDEPRDRSGVDCQKVNLLAPEPKVASEDPPALCGQPLGDERLTRVAGALSMGSSSL